MNTIRVAAAVIVHEGKIFAAQRGYGEFRDGWEFPGGKIEPGETPQHALEREILEEFDTEIRTGKLVTRVEYDYPKFHLSMDCFLATIVSGNLLPREHEASKWLTPEDLDCVGWLPADRIAEKELKKKLEQI